jgi:hypothetical protein
VRIAPPEFVAEMQRLFGSMWSVAWREHLSRWVVSGPTADGRIVDQTWGWFQKAHPITGAMEPVSLGEDGLPPYRGVSDRTDQLEILTNMERSYLFNRDDADQSVRARFSRIGRENARLKHKQQMQRAANYADLIGEVRIARPWKMHHTRARGAVLVSSAAGTRRTEQYDHQNGRPLPSS